MLTMKKKKKKEKDKLLEPIVARNTLKKIQFKKIGKLFFIEERFLYNGKLDPNHSQPKVVKWRMKERMKTVSVALVLCLNIGVDPPDVVKTAPCARLECWIDPFSAPPQKALDSIGKALQNQYERWQHRARYKQCLDPTVEEVKKLCSSLRRNAKEERVLFHYNGHGVPRPTANGELWVFNKNFTQYIPLSIYELQSWMGSPSIYVFDCSAAGLIVNWFNQFAQQREREYERLLATNPASASTVTPLKDCILLAACGTNELLPMNPELPADVFTSCLTTPIKMALRWFCSHTIMKGITFEMLDKIPGRLTDRRTPLGELNWIFTAVTDTIAWNVLPPDLFQKLFRQDLLVASLFRNFLLAERIMRSANCTPISCPKLPPTYQHPMWQAWDLSLDICLSQLPTLLEDSQAEFKHSPFFAEQLTAFEVWLEFGSEKKKPPEQLPIVLQVLLSQTHRLRALILLGRFLDLGSWAINQALSVGIFPYVLKLLQSPDVALRQILVFIWAKILALDKSCQVDLVKDNGHSYFLAVLGAKIPGDQRTLAAFVLTVIMDGCPSGQAACLNGDLLRICLNQHADPDPTLRRWVTFCLSKLWENNEEAKWAAIRESAHEKLCALLTDPIPEVRAAAVYALGVFIGGSQGNEQRTNIELNLGLTLLVVTTADSSPLVRKAFVFALSRLVHSLEDHFKDVVRQIYQEEIAIATSPHSSGTFSSSNLATGDPKKLLFDRKRTVKRNLDVESPDTARSSSSPNLPSPPMYPNTQAGTSNNQYNYASWQQSSVYGCLWKVMMTLSVDPFPEVASLANAVIDRVNSKVTPSLSSGTLPFSEPATPLGVVLAGGRDPSSGGSSNLTALVGAATGSRIRKPIGTIGNAVALLRQSTGTTSIPASPKTTTAGKIAVRVPVIGQRVSDVVGPGSAAGGSPPRRPSIVAHNVNDDAEAGVDEDGVGSGFVSLGSKDPVHSIFVDDTSVILHSTMYEWSCEYFSKPIMKPKDHEDLTAPVFSERLWRRQRNKAFISEAKMLKDKPGVRKLEDQIAILDNGEMASILLFHPFDPTLIVNDQKNSLSIWNWERGEKTHTFNNNNFPGSRISALTLINEHDVALLLVGSDDGVVKVWKGYEQADTLSLVSAWRALSDIPHPRIRGMVINWQQETGLLLASGDVPHIRVWDVERELSVQDVATLIDSPVTCITHDKTNGGRTIVIGCGDGSLRTFDYRAPPKFSPGNTYTEHESWIVNVEMPKCAPGTIVSGSHSGEIKFWDVRNTASSVSTFSSHTTATMTALAVHDYAPILASGSPTQKIKVMNFSGEELSMIRYHDGFLGQRIGPVSCLSFHPYKLILAAGATDSIISIYESSS